VKLKGTKKHLNTFRHQKRKTNPWHTDDISQQDKPNKKAPKRRARRAKRKKQQRNCIPKLLDSYSNLKP
jgi:hypothetical protein